MLLSVNTVTKEDGTTETHPMVDLGITIDERLADGYYYSKSMRIFRELMNNPKLLEETLDTEVNIK